MPDNDPTIGSCLDLIDPEHREQFIDEMEAMYPDCSRSEQIHRTINDAVCALLISDTHRRINDTLSENEQLIGEIGEMMDGLETDAAAPGEGKD